MRQVLGFLFVCTVVLCFQAQGFGANVGKVGVVDMETFQEKSKAFEKVRQELKAKFDGLQQKLDKEKDELLKVEEEFKKQSMMLSLDAKEDKRKDLEKKQRQYKFMADEFTREMKDAELEVRKRVGKEVEKVVGEIGKKEGYTIILERSTFGLLYYDAAIDITDQVVKAYDQTNK
jgi:outer membrane protein